MRIWVKAVFFVKEGLVTQEDLVDQVRDRMEKIEELEYFASLPWEGWEPKKDPFPERPRDSVEQSPGIHVPEELRNAVGCTADEALEASLGNLGEISWDSQTLSLGNAIKRGLVLQELLHRFRMKISKTTKTFFGSVPKTG